MFVVVVTINKSRTGNVISFHLVCKEEQPLHKEENKIALRLTTGSLFSLTGFNFDDLDLT